MQFWLLSLGIYRPLSYPSRSLIISQYFKYKNEVKTSKKIKRKEEKVNFNTVLVNWIIHETIKKTFISYFLRRVYLF